MSDLTLRGAGKGPGRSLGPGRVEREHWRQHREQPWPRPRTGRAARPARPHVSGEPEFSALGELSAKSVLHKMELRASKPKQAAPGNIPGAGVPEAGHRALGVFWSRARWVRGGLALVCWMGWPGRKQPSVSAPKPLWEFNCHCYQQGGVGLRGVTKSGAHEG